jgi:hypothetical protein
MGIEVVDLGQAGIEDEGPLEFFFRIRPIQVVVEIGHGQVTVGFPERIVFLQGLESRCFHFREGLPGRDVAEEAAIEIG